MKLLGILNLTETLAVVCLGRPWSVNNTLKFGHKQCVQKFWEGMTTRPLVCNYYMSPWVFPGLYAEEQSFMGTCGQAEHLAVGSELEGVDPDALHRCARIILIILGFNSAIGMFESPKCDVNPQPNTRGIGPLVGRTSGYHRSVMHVLAVIFWITYHFSVICQYIFIRATWSVSVSVSV